MLRQTSLSLTLVALLSACSNTLEKIERVGVQPPLNEVKNPTQETGYKPISWPMPAPTPPPTKEYANSLWQPGSRTFYRDQRASRVGDILKVNVAIKNKAEVKNETERKRDTTDHAEAPEMLGLQDRIFKALPGEAEAIDFLTAASNTNTKGTGNIKREEKIETQVAAMVTQVLPNGNLVISGTQEMRVNYEVREIGITGVVRPQDIRSDNTIDSTQIAEARINYGGRGQITDVQQPRWGSQVMDVILPF